MEKPKIGFKISVPSEKSPVSGESATCGASWYSNIEVRSPYRGMDKYVTTLPIMQEIGPFPMKKSEDLESYIPDLKKAAPELVKISLHNNIKDGIIGAGEILNSYRDAGYMDDGNASYIESIIDRSKKYYDKAISIIKYLRHLDSDEEPSDWPEGDQLMIFRLLKASIENVRCAQEAAASVGIYYRNKKAYDSQPGSLKYSPKQSRTPPTLGSEPIPEMPEPEMPKIPGKEVEGEEDKDSSPPSAKKKKKDNTFLIIGAAALGLLAMR